MTGPAATKASPGKGSEQALARSPERPRGPAPSTRGAGVLALQRAAGNRAVTGLLQRDADGSGDALHAVPPIVRSVLSSGRGQPLHPGSYAFLGPAAARDLPPVRIHTDDQAARSAAAIGARAYTAGRQIVFGRGQYAPGTAAGRRLLGHELAHVVEQGTSAASGGPVFLQREPEPPPRFGVTANLPPLTLSGTDLTLIPGPLTPGVLGSRIPLPASLRLTNALGIGPGPGWVVDVSPRLLTAHILESVALQTRTRPGTPPGAEADPANQAAIRLLHPIITFDPATGALRGRAVLSMESEYPSMLKGPTDIDVDITSTEIGQFSGRLGYGPLEADFNLRFHYDTGRLEQALRPVATPEGGFAGLWSRFQAILRDTVPGVRLESVSDALHSLLQALIARNIQAVEFATRTAELVRQSMPAGANLEGLRIAARQLADELLHPGFTLTGGLGLQVPLFGRLPLSRFSATAPTTAPLERPLLGAPTAYPLTYSAYGTIIAPPGALTRTAVPAFGYTRSEFGERRGQTLTAAALPTFSPPAISAGAPFVEQFPVYLYAEYSRVHRVSNDLDLGVRLTLQVSTPELPTLLGGGPAAPLSPEERYRRTLNEYQEATRREGPPELAPPNVGLSVFGRFNAF